MAERKWRTVIPLGIIVIGLALAAVMPPPLTKMIFLCVAGFGFLAVPPVFWTLRRLFSPKPSARTMIAPMTVQAANAR